MRMITRQYSKRRLFIFLIPFLIGICGILFSRELNNLGVRAIVLSVSLAVPLFAAGSLLSRFHSSRVERLALFAGLISLCIGAAISAGGITETLQEQEGLSIYMGTVSRVLGMASLALGLLVVMIMTVRRGEDVEEFAERFWLLAEHIKEGFVLSTAEGTIFLVNRRFLEMTDLTEKQVVGRNARELAGAMGIDMIQSQLENRARGISSEYEVSFRVRGEDRRLAFNGTPIFNSQGKITATLATVRDITEQHRLSQRVDRYAKGLQQLVEEQTQKLIQSEERFRQLLLSMNEGFLTLDTQNRIQFANAHIAQLLGHAEQELVGQDVFDLLDANSRAMLLNLLAQGSGLQERSNQRELIFVDASGRPLPALVGVAYVRDEAGEGPVYSLVITGVQELKELQRKLEERAQELERANAELRMHDRAKDSFLSNVSHELKTPLSTIQGYIEMLLSGNLGTVESTQATALKVMVRNAERLSALINEMIEFSRMEIRGVQVNLELRSAKRLVRDAVASAHPQALKKEITLNVECPDNLPHAWFDREKMNQVLAILLNNALKFTDQGGTIDVRAVRLPDETLTISVSDTGIGIESGFQQKIFEKFFQVDSSKTRRYEGTGIGLSIAKSIVAAHGGDLAVTSTPGEGSTFTITLPGLLFDIDPNLAAQASLHNLRVLVVDEGKSFPECIGAAVTALGGVSQSAISGYACVREAAEFQPDVVLLNESLNDVAGQSTLPMLRQQPDTGDLPVVVATSEKPARLREMGRLWPHVTFLPKPFNPVTLVERLLEASGKVATVVGPDLAEVTPVKIPRVLVVDGDAGLLEWVEIALRKRSIACYCAQTMPQALELALKEPPDVVFLDNDVPAAAEEAVRTLCTTPGRPAKTPLYLMTGVARKGAPGATPADGALLKPFNIEEMAAIVHASMRQRIATEEPVPMR